VDVCLQQNITPGIDLLVNSVAKVIIISMLNGIPSKHDKVFFSTCFYCVVIIVINIMYIHVLQVISYSSVMSCTKALKTNSPYVVL